IGDVPNNLLQLGFGSGGDGGLGPLDGQGESDCTADAAASAGDESNTASQFRHGDPPRAVRSRVCRARRAVQEERAFSRQPPASALANTNCVDCASIARRSARATGANRQAKEYLADPVAPITWPHVGARTLDLG